MLLCASEVDTDGDCTGDCTPRTDSTVGILSPWMAPPPQPDRAGISHVGEVAHEQREDELEQVAAAPQDEHVGLEALREEVVGDLLGAPPRPYCARVLLERKLLLAELHAAYLAWQHHAHS